jgi:hypothetical protein
LAVDLVVGRHCYWEHVGLGDVWCGNCAIVAGGVDRYSRRGWQRSKDMSCLDAMCVLEWRNALVLYTIYISRTRSRMLSKIERRVLNNDDEITHFPRESPERMGITR